jgi:hypothetical protein
MLFLTHFRFLKSAKPNFHILLRKDGSEVVGVPEGIVAIVGIVAIEAIVGTMAIEGKEDTGGTVGRMGQMVFLEPWELQDQQDLWENKVRKERQGAPDLQGLLFLPM